MQQENEHASVFRPSRVLGFSFKDTILYYTILSHTILSPPTDPALEAYKDSGASVSGFRFMHADSESPSLRTRHLATLPLVVESIVKAAVRV